MSSTPTKSRANGGNLKLWTGVISVGLAAIAVVPPVVATLNPHPTYSQGGHDNQQFNGGTFNSNTQTTNNNFFSRWKQGVRQIVGKSSESVAVPDAPGPQARAAEPKTAEPGALGTIVSNASLLNDSTWSPEVSRVTRLLTFAVRLEAVANGDKFGSINVVLARDGRNVCTISLNTQTSTKNGAGVRWGSSTCYDTLPANGAASYHAKVNAMEMTPITISLSSVQARQK
ncbi:MAG TPA: hypothetical protein VGM84_21665 [Steroidobacteraceae bacterium]